MKLSAQVQEVDNGFFVQIAGAQDTQGRIVRQPVALCAKTIDDVCGVLKQCAIKGDNGEPANAILLNPHTKVRE